MGGRHLLSLLLLVMTDHFLCKVTHTHVLFSSMRAFPVHPAPCCLWRSNCLSSINHRGQCAPSHAIIDASVITVQGFLSSVSGFLHVASQSIAQTVVNTQPHNLKEMRGFIRQIVVLYHCGWARLLPQYTGNCCFWSWLHLTANIHCHNDPGLGNRSSGWIV